MELRWRFVMAYLLVLLVTLVTAVSFNKTAEGYQQGLLSDCPGSWKPVTISRKNLERLWISVMNPGRFLLSGYTTYNYYHIQNLVKNPMIDFKNKKTFLYVGGYGDFTLAGPGRFIANMYREMGYNALVLDTFQFTFGLYPHAARIMRGVGKHTGEMLAQLTKQGLNPKNLTLLGISLGGETISFIAKSYQEITGKNISFLIGLDPAGPCYRHLGPKDRLDPSDADFVLMLTTNMDGFGIGIPAGTATFYVNGGEYQPGYIPWLPCGAACSHLLASVFWISSLYNPGMFVGVQCDSVENARHGLCYDKIPMVTNTMDMAVDRTKPGIYYLPTSNRVPYGIGMKGLEQWVKNKGRL